MKYLTKAISYTTLNLGLMLENPKDDELQVNFTVLQFYLKFGYLKKIIDKASKYGSNANLSRSYYKF